MQGGKDLNTAIQDLLPGIIKESKKVLFNGDNYTEEWHKEAEKRGLPNLQNTVDALPVIIRKDTIELFAQVQGATASASCKSRFNILCENYVKTVNIEAKLTRLMGQTMILPAACATRREVADGGQRDQGGRRGQRRAGGAAQDADERNQRLPEVHRRAGPGAGPSRRGRVDRPRQVLARQGDPGDERGANGGDKLEAMVADDLWPLPTYREMLFIK